MERTLGIRIGRMEKFENRSNPFWRGAVGSNFLRFGHDGSLSMNLSEKTLLPLGHSQFSDRFYDNNVSNNNISKHSGYDNDGKTGFAKTR